MITPGCPAFRRARILVLLALHLCACKEGTPDAPVAPEPPPTSIPTTLVITPSSAVLASLGQTVQLTATVRDQTGTVMSGVTVNWASSNGGIVTVDAAGIVTAVGNGATNITATVQGGGASGSAAITVAQQIAEVRLMPDSTVFRAIGETLQMSADALDANGHSVRDARVTWSSSDEAVVTVSNDGLVTATGNGDARITAAVGLEEATADFSVEQEIAEVRLTPDPQVFRALGATLQMSAAVVDANGNSVASATVTWASTDESVVTVSSSGLVTATGNGRATVTASSDPASATADFTVEQEAASLSVSPGSPVLIPSDTLRLTADALDANQHPVADVAFTWMSDDEAVATVDAAGLVTALAPGPVDISVQVPGAGLIATAEVRVVSPDREALAEVYNATGGSRWSDNSNWLTEAPLHDWYGVTTDAEGRVVNLVLRANQLSGSLPPALGQLERLDTLDLSGNRLSGTIPPELGGLANLHVLKLERNQLSGTIPTELSRLSNLQDLSFAVNQLTGTIPAALADLSSLRELRLHENGLGGTIPSGLGRLANLRLLSLCCNTLTGTIPSELGNLSALDFLGVQDNRLTGALPPELARLSRLHSLYVHRNRGLSGPIPQAYVNLRLNTFNWIGTQLCSPSNQAFQDWLASIPRYEGGVVCASTRP